MVPSVAKGRRAHNNATPASPSPRVTRTVEVDDVDEDDDPQSDVDAELDEQGGAISALMHLARTIREGCEEIVEEIASGIESVAWELDRAQRGALSVPARQDGQEVAQTIRELIRGELLDDVDRAGLVDDLAPMIAELHRHAPPPRGNWKQVRNTRRDEHHRQQGRELAESFGWRKPSKAAAPKPKAKAKRRASARARR